MFIFSIPDSLPHKELIWVLDIKKHYYHIAWRNIDATYMKCTHQAKLHKQKVGLWLCRTVNFFIEVVKNCGDWQLMSVWFWTCVLEGGWWKYPEMKLVMLVSHLLYPPPPPRPFSPTDLHVVLVMFTGTGIAASQGCIQSYSGVTPKCLYISSLTELEGGQWFSASHRVQGETANGCCYPAKFSAARKPAV